jgi:pimeloyl-ACP methyl ester carboxylesterase
VRGEAGIGKSALLAAHVPALAPRVRERLLGEAAGNPLALMELPVALGSDQLGGAALPEWLPLTARLEQAFAARVSELPTITRRLLLVAAVDHDGDLAEVLGAAAAMLDQADAAVKPEAPAAAVEARLVEVDEQGLRFRHPLVVGAATRAAADGDHELAVNLLWLVAQRCFWADPGRIDVLTLIVHGDDDQIVPIDASARRSVELVSGATLKVYPGAPHGLAQVAPQGPVQHRPARLPEGLNLQRARPGFPGPAQPTRYAARSADRSAPLA